MKKRSFIKLISLAVAMSLIAFCFAACSSNEEPQQSTANQQNTEGNSSPAKPFIKDKHITPDLSKAEVPKASNEILDTSNPEKFVKALESFVNPNGNEYDAVSIIGEFRYDDEGVLLLRRLKTAAKAWHEIIEKEVGQKCLVSFELLETRKVDPADKAVTEWNEVNGKTAEDYAKLTCEIRTNYASDSLKYVFEVVKVDGRWYLSTLGTLDKIRSIITTDIYR